MSGGVRDADALIGSVLQDRYRVTRLIGRGGMGAVYEGTQLQLAKRIAIKVLARDLSSNQQALARFRREAEVTSQLGHPHIVQVNDFGSTPSGDPYLVMEYLEGEDLDQRISRTRRISLADTANIIKQIASALSSTHARGIVHRDLKPANVFLLEIEGEADFVKIVDFGISKVRAASLRLTGQSALLGTPNYMSPEQAAGQIEAVDHRTDQWSLACIAYEMLSGRGPFLGETVHSLIYQVINQEPPRLGQLNAALPPDVEKVVARGMAKAKGDRFPTINAFARAFAAATAGGTLATVIPTPFQDSRPEASSPQVARAAPTKLMPPQPTTLSRTASELGSMRASIRARLTSKWTISGGAALLAAVGLLSIRARPSQTTRVQSARVAGPVVAPIVTPAREAAPPVAATAVATPPPAPPVVAAPEPAPPAPAPAPPPPAAAAAEPARPKRANGTRATHAEGERRDASRTRAPNPAPRTPAIASPKSPPAPAKPARPSIIEEL
jgi:serine/threonine-protein kinase